jgi:Fic family protein
MTVAEIAEAFNMAYHTARSDIERLVSAHILVEMRKRRPRAFVAREIFEAAYGV